MTQFTLALLLLSPLLPQIARAILPFPLLNDVTLLLFLVGLGALRAPQRFYLFLWRPFLVLAVLGFILGGALRNWAAGYSPDLVRALATHFISPAVYLLFLTFAFNYFRRFDGLWFGRILALAIVASAASFFLDRAILGWEREFSGYLGSSVTTGGLYVAALPMVIAWSNLSGKRKRAFRLLAATMVVVILLSLSRASVLALAVFPMAHFIIRSRFSTSIKVLTVAAAIGLGGVLYSGPVSRVLQVEAWESTSELNRITTGRAFVWASAVAYLRDPSHFLWGGGAQDFLYASSSERSAIGGGGLNTHNHFLMILVDYGFVALALVVLLYVAALRTAVSSLRSGGYEERNVAWGIIYTAMGVGVIGTFLHFNVGSTYTAFLWLQVGWLMALRKRVRPVPNRPHALVGTSNELTPL